MEVFSVVSSLGMLWLDILKSTDATSLYKMEDLLMNVKIYLASFIKNLTFNCFLMFDKSMWVARMRREKMEAH